MLQQISDVSHMQREITFGSTSDSFPTTLRVPNLIQYKIIFQPLAPPWWSRVVPIFFPSPENEPHLGRIGWKKIIKTSRTARGKRASRVKFGKDYDLSLNGPFILFPNKNLQNTVETKKTFTMNKIIFNHWILNWNYCIYYFIVIDTRGSKCKTVPIDDSSSRTLIWTLTYNFFSK